MSVRAVGVVVAIGLVLPLFTPVVLASERDRTLPKLPAIDRLSQAEMFYRRGLEFVKQNKDKQAYIEFTRALEQNHNYVEALVQRGYVLLRQNAHRSAYDDFDRAAQLRPNYVDALLGRGKALMVRGTAYYGEAIEDFSTVIRLQPNHADAYYLRSMTSSDDRRYLNLDRALSDMSQFLKLNKNPKRELKYMHEPSLVMAYTKRGQIYLDKKEFDRAIADATQAIEIDSRFGFAYLIRGEAYARKRDFQRAIADYTKELEVGGLSSITFSARAHAYEAIGDFDRAIADYTEELEFDGFENPRAYYNRGRAYLGKGDQKNAIADFEKVVKLTEQPDFPGHTINAELRIKAQDQLRKLKSRLSYRK